MRRLLSLLALAVAASFATGCAVAPPGDAEFANAFARVTLLFES